VRIPPYAPGLLPRVRGTVSSRRRRDRPFPWALTRAGDPLRPARLS
jgi:hypothetical protein